MPPLSSDMNAPLEPMAATPAPASPSEAQAQTAPAQIAPDAPITPVQSTDPQLAQPLPPLGSYNTAPLETAADIKDKDAPDIRYETVVNGLDDVNLRDRWQALSALRNGHGKATNATQVAARAKEDEGSRCG